MDMFETRLLCSNLAYSCVKEVQNRYLHIFKVEFFILYNFTFSPLPTLLGSICLPFSFDGSLDSMKDWIVNVESKQQVRKNIITF